MILAPLIPVDFPALIVPEFGRVERGRGPVTHPGPGKVLIRTDCTGVSFGTETLSETDVRPTYSCRCSVDLFPACGGGGEGCALSWRGIRALAESV